MSGQMTNMSAPSLSSMRYLLPSLMTASIWVVFIIICVAFIHCFHCTGNWPKIYENCNRATAKHQYIVRVKYGLSKKGYDPTVTSIKVHVFGESNARQSAFVITPQLMDNNNAAVDDKQFVSKFLLIRKLPIASIVRLVLTHTGKGSLFVYNLEIQDVDESKANIAYVSEFIENLPPDRATIKQSFPAGTQDYRPVEWTGVAPQVSAFEVLVTFVWFAVNTCPLMSVLLVFCNSNSSLTGLKICRDYDHQYLSSALTALTVSGVALVVLIVLYLLYKLGLSPHANTGPNANPKPNDKSQSAGIYDIISVVYLSLVVLIGLVMGIVGAVIAVTQWDSNSTGGKVPEPHTYWALAVFLAIVTLTTIYLPIFIIIAYVSGLLFPTSVEPEVKPSPPKRPKSLPKNKSPVAPDDDEDTGERYHQFLTSGKVKVKSISQYGGIGAQKKAPQPEPGDTGEGYYQQLMKDRKHVKSISNY